MKEYIKNNKAHFAKKIIAIGMIVFGMVFVFVNRGLYYSTHREYVKITQESKANPIIIEFEGDRVFEQEFYGWNGNLKSLTMRFMNQGNQGAEGMVYMEIVDEEGNILQSTEKPVSKIKTNKKRTFYFEQQTNLLEGKTYVLRVRIEGARNPQGFGVYTYPEKGEMFGQLYQDGEKVPNRLGVTMDYIYYNYKAPLHMYMFLVMALIVVLVPFTKVDQFVEKKWNKTIDTNVIISRIFFFATPLLCFMITERFNDYNLVEMIHRIFRVRFIFNLLIYVTVWLIVYVIVNRTQYTSMIVLSLAFAAGIANYYVWIFRGCPILATDVQSLKTAINVAANFSYNLDLTGIWGVVYIITFLSILLSLRGYKGIKWKQRGIVLAVTAGVVMLFNVVFFHSEIVQKSGVKAEVWHPQQNYAKNGTALSFVLSWTYTQVEKPSGYSADKIKDVIAQYPSDEASPTDAVEQKMPNVIAIMNESLADLSYNGSIEYSEDYLPFLHSMEEDTIKGKLYVSIQGANTANSEFEFLTGNSMTFLPYRCIPYNLYVKDRTPSMAQNMQAQGFAGINSYHPYLASGWNRTNVYPLMGFHNFFSQEYYYETGNSSLVRNYISDEADFKQIIQDYEASKAVSNAPFYLFNVTMQNHGGYDGARGVVDTDITIESEGLAYKEAEQYINLAKKSDEAFEMLIHYFKQVEEPTIIVMFGDHQPPITNSFYSQLIGKNVNSLPTEKQALWYATPYVIWANYDIEEQELDMSANYLSSYVMQLAGVKLTGYNKYLLDLQKTLPVISAVCYMDAEGNIYANDEKSEYSDLLEQYQMIQYNELFDLEHRYDEFFFLQN